MRRVSLVLALHNHQPVGNFDAVFDACTVRSYLPTLDVWNEFPEIPLALHNSGPLWDWLVAFRPEYLDRVRAFLARGQMELMTGGYYEPILPAIPDEDKVGQIRKHRQFLRDRFGCTAETLWLTERVWEPGLPRPLAQAGVHAVLVDDEHFHAAGIAHRDLAGYFRTEDSGHSLAVFPILKELRYLVPFRPPEETVEFLRAWGDDTGERLAVLGDDGEKFGVWPETHKLVFEDGWLRRFLTLLRENADWLEVTTPGRWQGAHGSCGLVYLPTASYSEMSEWALPTAAQAGFERLRERLAGSPADSAYLRGGFWRNFLSKYDEANRMHKRATDLSRRVHALPEELREAPREALWRSQCNCAYWHGVFGGLYLPHLRDAVYRNLIECETALSEAREVSLSVRELDLLSAEGKAWLLRNDHVELLVAPERGGALLEWDDLRTRHNLGNTLTRRIETYHDRLPCGTDAAAGDAGDGAASIHERVRVKEPGLDRLLAADPRSRASFLDHWLDPALTAEAFRGGTHEEWADLMDAGGEAALEWDRGCVFLTIGRICDVGPAGAAASRIKVLKRYGMLEGEPGFEVRYTLRHEGGPPLRARFGVEWNVTFLTGSAPDRWLDLGDGRGPMPLSQVAQAAGVELPTLTDEWLGLTVECDIEPRADAWMFPVETVSLSEDGFERNYQGTCLLFHWLVELPAGGELTLRFEPRHLRAGTGHVLPGVEVHP